MTTPAQSRPAGRDAWHGANRPSIAFVGFGEAASAIVAGWSGTVSADIAAYDIRTDVAGAAREAKLADYRRAGVRAATSNTAAIRDAHAVFSLVTADQAHAAACSSAASLPEGSLFLDCNSCAPQTKQASAAIIEAAGGRYVDVAIMAPIHPLLHRSPVLVSGPHASAALDLMIRLDMDAKDADGEIGRASAIKLVRSIMMKGLEALAVECVLAGRRLGVDDVVVASLEQTYPGFDWERRTGQMLERMMVHGRRRAAEMDEAAAMVAALGLSPRMASATADWQRQVGGLGLEDPAAANASGQRARRADAISSELERPATSSDSPQEH
ncbi:MAG: DUF1932 domain-containing protein [Hyphomicrobiaceae bacterium]